MRSAAFVAAVALLGVGCAAIVGADFERPGAAGTDSSADAGGLVPIGASGECPAARKNCANVHCALLDDPFFGCAESGQACTPCPTPPHAKPTCSPQTFGCDFACEIGFERVGDACVGWQVERFDARVELFAVGGSPGHGVFVAGEGARAFHSTGDGVWDEVSSGAGGSIHRIWGLPTGEVYAAARPGLVLPRPRLVDLTGTQVWTAEERESQRFSNARAVWASSRDDVYVAADGATPDDDSELWHFAANAWQKTPRLGMRGVSRIFGASASLVFAVGSSGKYAVRNAEYGNAWAVQEAGTTRNLLGVWAPNGEEAYFVGEGGTIVHTTGSGWTRQDSGTTETLTGIWGSGPDDIYVVGVAGTILHSIGDGRWASAGAGSEANLSDIWGTGPNDVYAVGALPSGTVILHRH